LSYARPGEFRTAITYAYEQYGDQEDEPERQPDEELPLQQSVRFLEYRMVTMNLAGAFPRVQGLPPFARDPYGYGWEHLDEWGRLGKYDWTLRTQLLPINYPFPLHRTFISFDVDPFKLDPRVHLIPAHGLNPSLCTLAADYIRSARKVGFVLLRTIRRIDRMAARNHFTLPSNYDKDWHFGPSWIRLVSYIAYLS